MEMVIELSDGQEVELKEVWDCCEGTKDCGSSVEVYDTETNELIATLHGMELPDTDDEDYNADNFIEEVETALDDYFFGED